MRIFHTIAAVIFYTLGCFALLGIAFAWQGIGTSFFHVALRSIDVPLIGSGLAYAGTSLLRSIGTEHPPRGVTIAVTLLCLSMFLVVLWLNFVAPPLSIV